MLRDGHGVVGSVLRRRRMQVDERKLRTAATEPPAAGESALMLGPCGHGPGAAAVGGMIWIMVAFDCAGEPCGTRVMEAGVEGGVSGR
jgi:hypothetical protein